MRVNALLIVGLVGLFACTARCADEFIEQATLFRAGEGGYNNYRIPSIILTKSNSLLAFCEGRQASSDAGEINLLVRRSTDGGKTFSPQKIVWADGKNTCGNPCAVIDQSTGFVWLLMTHNLGEDREKEITLGTAKSTRTVWITHSEDDGITWAAPRDITSQAKKPGWAWYATGPGNAIQLKNGVHAGRLVVPCDYVETGGNPDKSNSVVIYSDDHGANWKIGGEPPNHGFNESQVVELPDGAVMLNMRNIARPKGAEQKTERGVSVSKDGGGVFENERWDAALPEPRCQASIIRYSWASDGKSRIVFSNPALTKSRKTMTVRMSYDEGKTWPVMRLVFAGPSAYSSLVALPDRRIGLFYEAGEKKAYERIDLARFNLSWLTEGKEKPRE